MTLWLDAQLSPRLAVWLGFECGMKAWRLQTAATVGSSSDQGSSFSTFHSSDKVLRVVVEGVAELFPVFGGFLGDFEFEEEVLSSESTLHPIASSDTITA